MQDALRRFRWQQAYKQRVTDGCLRSSKSCRVYRNIADSMAPGGTFPPFDPLITATAGDWSLLTSLKFILTAMRSQCGCIKAACCENIAWHVLCNWRLYELWLACYGQAFLWLACYGQALLRLAFYGYPKVCLNWIVAPANFLLHSLTHGNWLTTKWEVECQHYGQG